MENEKNGWFYVLMAKIGLWVAATTVTVTMAYSLIGLFYYQDETKIGFAIQSAQALSFIAVTVYGWHKGCRSKRLMKWFSSDTDGDGSPDV